MIDTYEISSAINANRHIPNRWSRPLVTVHDNFYATHHDEYDDWNRSIEAGKSYLVGNDVPTPEFIRKHRSALTSWQKLAYQWALENPTKKLCIDNGRYYWTVCARGSYVEFGLPHQDQGGERHYITNNGKSKILVNVD